MEKSLQSWGEQSYLSGGQKKEVFVLVHNAGGSLEFFKYTYPYFISLGRVLSYDLRGHGQSQAPKGDYTVESHAKDLLDLCQKLNISNVTLIGLNYGACIGLSLSQSVPDLMTRLILIEPPMLMDSWIIKSVENHIRDLEKKNLQDYAEELVASVLVQADPEDVKMAQESFVKTSREVQISTYTHLLDWDRKFMKKSPHVSIPTLYVQSSKPFSTEEKISPYFENLHCGRVVDSGPWITLEVPDQFHSMVERFITVST